MITVKVLQSGEVYNLVDDAVKHSPVWCILFGGDRISCCGEAVALKESKTGNVIGVATIAKDGEDYCGTPAIVGLWIAPAFRKQGFSAELLKATLDRCRERGFKTVQVDVLSSHLMRTIEKLPQAYRELLYVRSLGGAFDLFA